MASAGPFDAAPRPRKRSLSCSSSDNDGSIADASDPASDDGNVHKLTRLGVDKRDTGGPAAGAGSPAPSYVCSLPPQCSSKPATFPTSAALLSHYHKHHMNVCSEPSCRKLFPDERFLELHISEFHDPVVAVRRERGEKTYECFLPSCGVKLGTPKGRRLHLISAHYYPKEFFFALPKYGLERLYSRFGDAASLVSRAPALEVSLDSASGAAENAHRAAFGKPSFVHKSSQSSKTFAGTGTQGCRQAEHMAASTSNEQQNQVDISKELAQLSFVPKSVRKAKTTSQKA